MKHHSKPHGNIHAMSIATAQVYNRERKKLLAETEEVRLDYQKQLEDKAADDWLRCLAMSGIVFREQTGDNKKTEKFLSRLAEKLQQSKNAEVPTSDLTAELARVTGIELEVGE